MLILRGKTKGFIAFYLSLSLVFSSFYPLAIVLAQSESSGSISTESDTLIDNDPKIPAQTGIFVDDGKNPESLPTPEISLETAPATTSSPMSDSVSNTMSYSEFIREFNAFRLGLDDNNEILSSEARDKIKAGILTKWDAFIVSQNKQLDDLGISGSKRNLYFETLNSYYSLLVAEEPSTLKDKNLSPSSLSPSEEPSSNSDSDLAKPVNPGSFDFVKNDINVQSLDNFTFTPKTTTQPAFSSNSGKTPLSVNQPPIPSSPALIDYPKLTDLNQDNGEIIINDTIADLAKTLDNNPVKIYNYIRNNIAYEPYYDAKKGSVGCLAERVCNDVDISSLTIALLRSAGIPARYHKQLALVSMTRLKDLLGVSDSKIVYAALASNDIPIFLTGENLGGSLDDADFSQVNDLVLEWVIPQIFYEYDERGANVPNNLNLSVAQSDQDLENILSAFPEKKWIFFDPILQPYDYEPKEIVSDTVNFDTESFWYNYLQYNGTLNPIDKYATDLFGTTGKDIRNSTYQSTRSITAKNYDILPPKLPYIFGNSATIHPENWSTLPNNKRRQVVIELLDDQTPVLQRALWSNEINNKDINLFYVGASDTDKATIESFGGLAYTPATLVDIKAVLEADNSVLAESSPLSVGKDLILRFTLKQGEVQKYISEKFSIAGNDEGIIVSLGKTIPDTQSDTPSKILLKGNVGLARTYLTNIETSGSLLEKSLDHKVINSFSRAVVTQNRILNSIGGVPTTFDFKGLSLDAATLINDYSNRGNYKDHRKDYRLLFALNASYQEAQIFTDIAGLDGISTVRGLQYAYAHPEDYTVHKITSANAGLIDTLALSENTKQNMRADVEAGNTVVTPNKFVTNGSWTGIFYVSLDPVWTGTYAIGEQTQQNGGWTTNQYTLSTWNNSVSKPQLAYEFNNGPSKFIYKDNSDKNILCSIKITTYNQIVGGNIAPGWNLAQHGKPCMNDNESGPYQFGSHDHSFIVATNGAYFKSSSDNYNYWQRDNFISAQIASKVSGTNVTIRKIFPYWGTYVYENSREKKLVVYNPQQTVAQVIEGKIYDKYVSSDKITNQYTPALLGYPTSSMVPTATYTLTGTDGDSQRFTNGAIYKIDRFLWPDDAYVVFGKIYEKHNELGGTSGMGFPDDDPQISGTVSGAVFQNFENGKKLRNTLGSDVVQIDDISQTLAVLKAFEGKNHDEVVEGVLDVFRERDYIGMGVDFASGIAIGEVIKKAMEFVAVKKSKSIAIKTSVKFFPFVGWVFAAGTISLAAYNNAPVYQACASDDETLLDNKPPAYYCGKLGANLALETSGIVINLAGTKALNSLGASSQASKLGKNKLIKEIEKNLDRDTLWKRVKGSIISNPKNRIDFYESVQKPYHNQDDINFVLSRPENIIKAAATKLGFSRIALSNDFVKGGQLTKPEFEIIEDMHQWIIKEFSREGKQFNNFDSLRTDYWKKAAGYSRIRELFSDADILKMDLSGVTPKFQGTGDTMHLHHLIPRSKAPEFEKELDNILPLPCGAHQWAHAVDGPIKARFGFANFVPCN